MRAKKAALFVAASAAISGGLAAIPGQAAASPHRWSSFHRSYRDKQVCTGSGLGNVQCEAIVGQPVEPNGQAISATATPAGLDPSTYMQAYGWSDSSGRLIGDGSGQTIALVDAYDDPNISSDLDNFDSVFGLPACNTSNGCLTKVDSTGGTNYPPFNSAWALEISLDVEWAHAIAPDAHILLVEASGSSIPALMSAEDYAGANAEYVSNSWGSSDSSSYLRLESNFTDAGVSYFAASGDIGGVVDWPASSPVVIAVGGTTLTSSNGIWSESGWSGSGGGCSLYESKSPYQVTAPNVSCGGDKATPDASADADPNSGLSVYDSNAYTGSSGWFIIGGTSASTVVWTARAADQGVQVTPAYLYAGYTGTTFPYGQNVTFRDVTTGSNGDNAGVGYDLVTGLGSWLGTGGAGSTSSATITSVTCVLATCSFSGSGTGILSWNFGDGTSATGASVTHTYTRSTHYQVTLTDSDSTQATITIGCSHSVLVGRAHLLACSASG